MSTRTIALLCLVGVLAGCASVVSAPDAPTVGAVSGLGSEAAAVADPSGIVRVAYPDPVVSWVQEQPDDLAAGDLAALWALPLYRVDPLGRLRPGLAIDATTREEPAGDWVVEITLGDGAWSDGTPVTASDVVATAEALAVARPAAWSRWRGAEALDDSTVALRFAGHFEGWPWLLTGAPGVLPAHVLADGGLDRYADALPVVGGLFALTGTVAEERMSFAATTGSPLGSAGVAELEVLVVPDHDVALGLLAGGDVDVVLGHVALDPDARREQVPGADGVAVFGGSRFELLWELDGGSDAVTRQAAATRLDPTPFVDGLLRDIGRAAGGTVPALEPGAGVAMTDDVGGSVAVQLPRTVEGLGLLGRLLQAELTRAGVDTSLVRLDPPQNILRPLSVDARLRLVRVLPGRSQAALLAEVGMDITAGVRADAAGVAGLDPSGRQTSPPPSHRGVAATLADDPRLLTIAEVAIAHAWMPDRVSGIVPSGWPGLALWDVGAWRVPAAPVGGDG